MFIDSRVANSGRESCRRACVIYLKGKIKELNPPLP
jgi:hypothetical protein